MLPESWLPHKSKDLQAQEQPSRHTMAPDDAAPPSQPSTTHLIKWNEIPSEHCMLSLQHNAACEQPTDT
jgi:hypothetical protein